MWKTLIDKKTSLKTLIDEKNRDFNGVTFIIFKSVK